MDDLRLFSGTGNPELSARIGRHLGVPLGRITVKQFSDGEIRAKIDESVRGDDVFIVQPGSKPVNDNFMELLIMIDAFKRASARRVTVVMPYYCYARQDKKVKPREPIAAKLIANLLATAGANRLLTIDLHAGQIVGFFDLPVDHLYAGPIIAEYFVGLFPDRSNLVVVSPDVGGVPRARSMAEFLGTPIAIIVKRRPEPNESEVMEVIGDVSGRIAIMIDDMIDTGGSIIGGAEALFSRGAVAVYAACTHGVLSGDAVDKLLASMIEKVVVTDTIPLPSEKRGAKIVVVSVAGLLGEAIRRIHEEGSVSELFSEHWKGQS